VNEEFNGCPCHESPHKFLTVILSAFHENKLQQGGYDKKVYQYQPDLVDEIFFGKCE
jgi:hypothetical protein